MTHVQDDAESNICKACAEEEYDSACTLALKSFGPEILSFLSARLHSPADGTEAFSMFAEDLWKALPGFAFRCSIRGWMYTLARNAANRFVSAPHRRPDRNLAVTGRDSLSALIDQVRSTTKIYQKTDTKDRVRALREQLADEDQMLLILHVDRALPWREIAMVMHDDGTDLCGDALARETARLRKRFERVKGELKEMALREGLLKR